MTDISKLGVAVKFVDGVNLSAAFATVPTKTNKTGFRGVFYNSRRNHYIANCMVGGVRWRRSGYKTAEEAKKDRDKKHTEMLAEKGLL